MNVFKTTSIFFVFFVFPPNQAFLQNSFHTCSMSLNDFSMERYCSKQIQDGLQCVAKRIYKTSYDLDRKLRIKFNFRDMPMNIYKFCSLKLNNTSCESALDKIQNIETTCDYNSYRTNFLNYESCSVYKGFITSDLLRNFLSLYCLETDLSRGLIPSYGPQLKCYPLEFVKNNQHLNVLDYQVKYCKIFDYSTIKECTIKNIGSVSNNEYLNGKSLFQKDALKILSKTKYFCEKLLKIPQGVIDSCAKKDFDNCKRKAYEISSKPNTAYTPGTYLDCINEIYKECQIDLSDLLTVIQSNIQSSSTASNLTLMSCMVFFIICACSSSFKLIAF